MLCLVTCIIWGDNIEFLRFRAVAFYFESEVRIILLHFLANVFSRQPNRGLWLTKFSILIQNSERYEYIV